MTFPPLVREGSAERMGGFSRSSLSIYAGARALGLADMTVTDMLPLRGLYPPLDAQAGLKVLAVVRESRSPLARRSASSRRAELWQLENHYCNKVLRSP